MAETIVKMKQEQEMPEDRREWIPEVSKSTIGNVAGAFYDKGIRKMPQRMQKCIDQNSDYVDK